MRTHRCGPQLASTVLGDATFVCGSRFYLRHVAARLAVLGAEPSTRLYHFDFLRDPKCYPKAPSVWGVAHASELPFLFNQPLMESSDCAEFSAKGAKLSMTMGTLWSALAAGPLPGGSGWPVWNAKDEPNIVFDRSGGTSVEHERRAGYCDFWDVVYEYRQND